MPSSPSSGRWTEWVRGYRLDLTDSAGHPLDREMIHHTGVANFDRRQLLYPQIERLLGAGKETQRVTLPPWMGVPLEKGAHLAIYRGCTTRARTMSTGRTCD